ncbi:MAG: RecQ family ATP-dependent DNA helicase [bacterium]|jgi:ATP-dependent DNA helicase RecQ|nr:RecQ family ATP-dependent DNA helicase [Planctomycetota bacterium]HIL53248.1 RecQ family ATP-dependent DNA helicase [Planctomycetota bacterium]
MESLADQTAAAVRRHFGFQSLRPLQDRAIRAALEGRDALVVLPTGGGKSLCFQAPALVQNGLVVVVSPLISLMKDQVDGLLASGVRAAMLSSAQGPAELRSVYENLEAERLDLLYLAPERLAMNGFIERLDEFGMRSLAVDEAHCISHWGHDFRPEYRRIGELRERRPDLSIQAYTATATPAVQLDIVAQLGLRDPEILVGDFDRPNLTYRVMPRRQLVDQVLAVVQSHSGEAGIVYCLSRKAVDSLASKLAAKGVRCQPYHAGMTKERRTSVQDDFQGERIDVVVATVAFGMGIDRTDVRFVVHASLPKGVEQYSQETGRAGRDGLPAECVLLHSGADYHNWKHLMERSAEEARARGSHNAEVEKEAGLSRLGDLYGFATNALCRHRFLLEYFGQKASPELRQAGCGACDVCLGELSRVPDSQVLAQKILSCVVHCGQRYGAGHITDVLRGADTQRMHTTGHSQRSTHGLLKEYSAREVRGWIEQLTGRNLLASTGGQYPTLYLTKTGVAALRGEEEVDLFVTQKPKQTRRKAAASAAAEEGIVADEALFEHLRDVRRALARERGVPPYLIFNDRTLALMSALKPAADDDLLAIKGVGEKKAADLGPRFLAEIAEFCAARSRPDRGA